MLAACATGDDSPLCGYRPPPNARPVRLAKSGTAARRLRSAALPSSWDSREHGWITPVKNQNPWGTCWTFASYATLETQLLKSGRGEWDFSEKNMVALSGFEGNWNLGGNYDMAAAYLLRWGGAVMESNDVYRTTTSSWNAHPSVPLNPALHVQNVVWVTLRESALDNDSLKSAVMEYGAVAVSYCHVDSYCRTDNGAYYCNIYTNTYNDIYDDHAVTVVGWDDDYPAMNFLSNCRPPGDGAWLVKNSWGTGHGDGGYLHVSYYDMTFAMFQTGAVFIPATEEEDYTAVYGYDRLGYVGYEDDVRYTLEVAVFTSAWNEEVAAAGLYVMDAPLSFTVSLYTNVTRGAASPIEGGALASTTSGTVNRSGYVTIPLPSPVQLADRSNFAIVYAQNGTPAGHAVSISYPDYSSCNPQAGNTYLGRPYRSGRNTYTNWLDLAMHPDGPSIACLKAYTRSRADGKGNGPSLLDDGTAMLAFLSETNAAAYAQFGESFGAFANLVGANGRSLWTSWLAGFDPSSPSDNVLLLSIDMTGGSPSLSWSPDLGADRSYTIWGRDGLSPSSAWRVVPQSELDTTSAKFFKVSVGQKGE